MDIREARAILRLPHNYTHSDLRKQYHRLALRYHPDKNGDCTESTRKFREINDAYNTVRAELSACDADIDEPATYDELLLNLIGMTCRDARLSKKLLDAIKVMVADYSHKTLSSIPAAVLFQCYIFMNENKDILHIPDSFLSMVGGIVKTQENGENFQVITPSLEDMYESNVLKLEYGGSVYLIPLWHSEIAFDHDGCELSIRCVPSVPDHMSVDNNNDLHVHVKTHVASLLQKAALELDIGVCKISIPVRELRIVKYQTWTSRGLGIPRIDTMDIYSNATRGDVIAHIELY